MYFDAAIKVKNYIYLIEHFSRSLISIHTSSGKTKVEAYLPWAYEEVKMDMFFWENKIFIYSPIRDNFLIYDCLEQKTKVIELKEMEIDEAGYCLSNILAIQDDFIVLPFKGKAIKRYGINGEVKYRNEQWCRTIANEYGFNENLFGNIRVKSACIAGNQMFFSLIYGNKNYLCKYELDKEECFCSIVYNSDDIPIRGVYAYSNKILFRRIFLDKTEIIILALDSDEQKKIVIEHPSTFEEDVYGDNYHVNISVTNKIFELDENNLNLCRKIYCFAKSDDYIANGILFNTFSSEILMVGADYIKKYSIKEIVQEIRVVDSYQDAYKSVFDRKCIPEGKYKLYHLTDYLMGLSTTLIEKKEFVNCYRIGKLIWKMV